MNIAAAILGRLSRDLDTTSLTVTAEDGTPTASFTRRTLLEAVATWRRCLRDRGMRPGLPVVLSPSRGIHLPAAHLAALCEGAAVVPLNPALSSLERHDLLRACGASIALGCDRVADGCEESTRLLKIHWVCESEVEVALAGGNADPDTEPVERRAKDTALVLYTSGTTGTPKSVPLTHRNLLANLRALETLWERTEADRLLHVLPAHHFHGLVLGVYGSLLAANSTVLMPGFDARATLDAIRTQRISVLMAVPTMYRRILACARDDDSLAGLRLAISGSAPLPETLERDFTRRFATTLVNRYGLTETGILTSNPPGAEKIGSVGRALPGTELRIIEGEICARSPSVMSGYGGEGAKRANREAFRDGYFRTGDLGSIDKDGYLRIVGRAKDLIIVGGSNVVPGEVEAVLAAVEGVAEVSVAGTKDDDLGETVAAFVVPDGGDVSPAATAKLEIELRKAAVTGLARYKHPRSYRFVEELPRNAMGKIDRAKLTG